MRANSGSDLTTASAVYRAAFGLLVAASPQAIAFDDVLARARALSQSQAGVDDDRRTLRANLLEAFHHGIIEPLAEPWRCGEPGERPAASTLARAQATAGQGITTLHHKQLFPAPKVREMIPLLDGSRSVDQLVDAILPTLPAETGHGRAGASPRRRQGFRQRAGLPARPPPVRRLSHAGRATKTQWW